jgi:hypothetical protein
MENTTVITDWGTALMTSLAGAMAMFFAALPKVLGFIVILVVGWFIASLVEKGVAAVLRAVRFNDLAQRSGFAGFVDKMGTGTDSAGLIGLIVKWFIRLIALVVAFDALGLPAVSDVLRQLLLWLPNLIVALVVLVIGGLAARAISNLVRGAAAEGGLGNPEFLSKVASAVIWTFAIVVAVNQIGIAKELVNTLFMGVVGAATLALGLSFGLGAKDTAGEIVRKWYRRGEENKDRIVQTAQAASDRVESSTQGMGSRGTGGTGGTGGGSTSGGGMGQPGLRPSPSRRRR